VAIRVYNTLSRRKEEFRPGDPSRVRIYVCGITPYATSHIGHSRFAILWDTIRRYLEYKGYGVVMVQNFTDVEDKLIEASREIGKPAMEIARKYIKEFLRDTKALGVKPPQFQPRASDHMDDIVAMVKGLIEKGYAYEVDGDVYFEVDTFPGYGKLSGRDSEDVRAGARVEVDERKRDPRDFALWKAAKPGEPAWPSPWGPGRPGWHIECSVMSLKYLGESFDLHGGGTDLIFPHHENEIAQSEAYLGGERFARMWVHHEMLNIRSEKMSKSLGNIVTMHEVLEKFPGPAVRFFQLSTHYRKILEFSFDLVLDAGRGWRRLQKSVSEGAAYLWAAGHRRSRRGAGLGSTALGQAVQRARQRFEEAMDDDFNTAEAIGVLFDLSHDANAAFSGVSFRDPQSPDMNAFAVAIDLLVELGGVLGIVSKPRFEPKALLSRVAPVFGMWSAQGSLTGRWVAPMLRSEVQKIVDIRDEARAKKAWDVADRIRGDLAQAGITVEDSKSGSRWRPEVEEIWRE
jgi:cysteinyl-tRNA synthetase